MQPGIQPTDPRVLAVVNKAEKGYGLRTKVNTARGTNLDVVEIYLLDGPKVTSAAVPDFPFRVEDGVSEVRRVTPSKVSIHFNGSTEPHRFKIGGIEIGEGHPCRLVSGPCTIDRNVFTIAKTVREAGATMLRGGWFKPRTDATSFCGFGPIAIDWLFQAAAENDFKAVFTEVFESSDLDLVRKSREKSGFKGGVVCWVGARTENLKLLKALGHQHDLKIMLKHSHRQGTTIADLVTRASFVLSGNIAYGEDGQMDKEASTKAPNQKIIFCLRGTAHDDKYLTWRFLPNHHWITSLRRQFWPPVAVDTSHSAGTMKNNLVLQNTQAALEYCPDLLMVEGGYPTAGFPGTNGHGFCDAEQQVPAERYSELVHMIKSHNKKHFGKDIC